MNEPQVFYIVTATKLSGQQVFAKLAEGSSVSATTTSLPGAARMFEVSKANDALVWVEKIRATLSRTCDQNSIRVMIFEQRLRSVSEDDFEFHKALRMNAIAKLTAQEIEALGLEKVEIERRLNAD